MNVSRIPYPVSMYIWLNRPTANQNSRQHFWILNLSIFTHLQVTKFYFFKLNSLQWKKKSKRFCIINYKIHTIHELFKTGRMPKVVKRKYSNNTSGSAGFCDSGTPFSTFSSGLASFVERYNRKHVHTNI